MGAGLLVAAISGSALARPTEDRNTLNLEIHKEHKLATFTSPLPTPEPQSEIAFPGAVEVMTSDMWGGGGRTAAVTAAREIKARLTIGALAKVHALRLADGSLLAREIAPAQSGSHDEDNSNTNGNDNSNDNHNGNSHGNGNVNSNKDHGNSNEHHSNVNSNDGSGNGDHGGNMNLNHHNGNDDHGGGSN